MNWKNVRRNISTISTKWVACCQLSKLVMCSSEIQEAAYRFQRDLEENKTIVVGVNRFTQGDEGLHMEMMKLDPAIEAEQCRRLAELRARRDNEKVTELRSRLETAASTNENLMPLFITCVENDVTLGEICHTLRDVWGEYRPVSDL